MRLRRPRVTVRRIMVVVAVAALCLGGELARRRRATFRALALSHAVAEEFDRFLIAGGGAIMRIDGRVSEIQGPMTIVQAGEGGGSVVITADATPGHDAASLARRAEYHAGLRRKYERAARFPWSSVTPDPPDPE